MQSQANKYDDSFQSFIYRHCKNEDTGTILLSTNDNKSCQISMENGDIVAASMARSKGYNVTTELLKTGIRRCSFNKNMDFPHSKDAEIDSSIIFLGRLEKRPHLTLVKDS